MAHLNPSRRIYLAGLLQQAHNQQKCNTQRLEQSYHALRTSTRRLELCWENYCNELERELDVNNWKQIPRGPIVIAEVDEFQPEPEVEKPGGDKFPDLPSPDSGDSWYPPTGEPPSPPRARPRSNNLQTLPPRHLSTNVQGPREIPIPTRTFPTRNKSTPLSYQKPAPYDLQGPRPPPSSTTTIPKRHASLPTREYLVALSNSRPPTPHPQYRKNHKAVKPNAMNSPPPLPKLPNTYSHRNTDQSTGKVYTVDGFKTPISHEKLTYEPGVQGHARKSASNGENALKYADDGLTRNHVWTGRTRLHKKRKSEDLGRCQFHPSATPSSASGA
ncbi:MAG: hypothetical protein Q9171_002546 [Xanthocarpia ochracea]